MRYLWMVLFAVMVFAWTPDVQAQGKSERGEDIKRSDRAEARGPTASSDRRDGRGPTATRSDRPRDVEVRRDRQGDIVIRRDRQGDVDVRRDRRAGQAAKGKQGNGPAFCRTGEGHPVFGRQWCRDKGFGLGGYGVSPRWERQGWEDVILPAPRRRDGVLNRGTLGDVLGDVILGRFDRHRQYLGADGSLSGRWIADERGRGHVLELSAGSTPIARMLDRDGNGRADEVLLNVAR